MWHNCPKCIGGGPGKVRAGWNDRRKFEEAFFLALCFEYVVRHEFSKWLAVGKDVPMVMDEGGFKVICSMKHMWLVATDGQGEVKWW